MDGQPGAGAPLGYAVVRVVGDQRLQASSWEKVAAALRPPCLPDPKVLPGARRVLGFSPLIVDRHVSRFLLAFLTDDPGGL